MLENPQKLQIDDYFALGDTFFHVILPDQEEKKEQIGVESSKNGMNSTEEKKEATTQKITKVASGLNCKICYENEANALFLPCRHNISCEDCSKLLKICPVCNSAIEKAIIIFR